MRVLKLVLFEKAACKKERASTEQNAKIFSVQAGDAPHKLNVVVGLQCNHERITGNCGGGLIYLHRSYRVHT